MPDHLIMRRRTLLGGLGAMATTGTLLLPETARAEKELNPRTTPAILGPAATTSAVFTAKIDPDGSSVWAVSRYGDPHPWLLQFDAATGDLIGKWQAPEAGGACNLAVSSTTVYVGVTGGINLLAFDRATSQFQAVAQVANTMDAWICDLDITTDGQVHLGTYPACEVWSYDPATKAARNLGQINKSRYARAITANADWIMAGTMGPGATVGWNRATGERVDFHLDHPELAQSVAAMTFSGDLVYVAAGTSVVVLDPYRNHVLASYPMGGQVAVMAPQADGSIIHDARPTARTYRTSATGQQLLASPDILTAAGVYSFHR